MAEAVYGNERDLRELQDRGAGVNVALGRDAKAVAKVDREGYPAKARIWETMESEDGRRRNYGDSGCPTRQAAGSMRRSMRFRRFSFRGLGKAQVGRPLVCPPLNVTWLHGRKSG